jgi:hypothetical protein
VEIGVILVTGESPSGKTGKLPKQSKGGNAFESGSSGDSFAHWDLLGRSVLARTIDRFKATGLKLISVVAEGPKERESSKIAPWEKTLRDYVRNGVRQTLVITATRYTEVDVAEVIAFHRQTSSAVTNVANEEGPLGITLIDSKCAMGGDHPISSRLPAFAACSSTYEYTGYVNHLSTAAEYRELIHRVLTGQCIIRPLGREVKPHVWVADGARIHRSVRLVAPTYVGAHSQIHAGALLAATSVERDSEIDCGTVAQCCSILPHTYIGPGLHVSHSLVNGTRLLHLGRALDIELGETGLIRNIGSDGSSRVFEGLGSLLQSTFRRERPEDAPTPAQAAASLERAQ